MFEWLTDLTSRERKTLIATFGGWAVDAIDVKVYIYVIPTLIAVWGISRVKFTITVTVLASATGGWVAGILADR